MNSQKKDRIYKVKFDTDQGFHNRLPAQNEMNILESDAEKAIEKAKAIIVGRNEEFYLREVIEIAKADY